MSSLPKRRVRAIWDSLLIDRKMVCQMFKGSVPVAISLGFYQATAVSEVYTSLGFLVSIIAVVTVNVLPRAKLMELTFNICLLTALAIPITMLSTWSGIQARKHTDPQNLHQYNSSQSAVTAIWLFFNILVSNSVQARYPALLIPTILYNIFVIVQYTSCSRFHTWTQCWNLIYLTIRCYYTGVGISFVSGMLVFPVTCRTEIFEVQEKFLHAVRGLLNGAEQYLRNVETHPTFPADAVHDGADNGSELRVTMANIKNIYVKMRHELAMAKREIAWGRLGAKDIGAITDLCREIFMPLSGLASVPDILTRIQEDSSGWSSCDFESNNKEAKRDDSDSKPLSNRPDDYDTIWRHAIGTLLSSTSSMIETMNDGLQHAGLQLEIIPQPGKTSFFGFVAGPPENKSADVESNAQIIQPGHSGFSRHLEDKLGQFAQRRVEALNSWANSEGLTAAELSEMTDMSLHRDRQQLYLILYIQHMIHSIGLAILDLCQFSDAVVARGTMKRNRLIVPSVRRLWKWFLSVFDTTESPLPDDDRPNANEEKHMLWKTTSSIAHDIDHLPPRNAFERSGKKIRKFQEFLKGPQLSFGFRSACATLSCAILAYLHQTQEIFTHYRLIWSVIISAIGANMSAGQSGVSYFLRILGSFAALIICYAVWYIPDGKVPGVIVVMWFVAFLQMYFLLRWPKYIIGWLVVFITEVLTIGYELQVRKIGVAAAESGGIYVFPPYYVAALRVACVLWGTVASIIFTYLPYPITARGLLRGQLGRTMELIANYHAVVHATIKVRLRGTEGDPNERKSRGRVLAHTRKTMFNKIMTLSSQIGHNVYLQKYEPSLGGRFPIALFQDILAKMNRILEHVSLLSFATQAWSADNPGHTLHQHANDRKWLEDLSRLIGPTNSIEEHVTSVLWELSAAISTGRPLPRRREAFRICDLSRKLRSVDGEVLGIEHVQEAGYSAFAVIEIISHMIATDLDKLVTQVESLVGVVDFRTLHMEPQRE